MLECYALKNSKRLSASDSQLKNKYHQDIIYIKLYHILEIYSTTNVFYLNFGNY